MPNSLLWIGLVAVWLFVLVPMLINRREPIRRTGDATLATRVLHRGGMARMVRRKPGRRSDPAWLRSNSRDDTRHTVDDTHGHADAETDELPERDEVTEKGLPADEDVRSEVSSAEASPTEAADDGAESDAEASGPADVPNVETPNAETFDAETPDTETVDAGVDSVPESKSTFGVTLADRMLGRTSMVVSDVDSVTEIVTEARPPQTQAPSETQALAEDDDVDREISETVAAELDQPGADDPLPPAAPLRRGRGGFDPEADAAVRAARYASRQRTVVGLAVAALLTLTLGLLVLPALLWLHGAIDVLFVLYLTYLRRQVRMEQEIRRRRLARLARGRLDHAGRERRRGPVPDRLRRPGALVLEIDDEDPVFDHLEYYHPAVHHDMARAVG